MKRRQAVSISYSVVLAPGYDPETVRMRLYEMFRATCRDVENLHAVDMVSVPEIDIRPDPDA
jgi:hypothetical protein